MDGLSFSLDVRRLQQADEPEDLLLDRDLVIVGAGPAGLTAGLYAGRALLNPLILVGRSLGGQVAATSDIENYPGFHEGIGGMALAEQMANHAARFGAETLYEEVVSVDFRQYPFVLRTFGPTYRAKAVILSTGASPRMLDVPGEQGLIGRGVSYCATCDGYFYRDKTVVVVGGGDSALDEGLYLAHLAKEVIVVHRRAEFRASAILQARAKDNEKMRFVLDSVVEEILGDQAVRGVRLRNLKTGAMSEIATDGVFVYVGLTPNTRLFEGQLELDASGYIVADKRQRTSVPGVFAAGDVQDPWFRQVVIAAGAGAAAAIEAGRFLAEKAYEEREARQHQAKGTV